MRTKKSTGIEQTMDIGTEEDYPASEGINDFFSQEMLSPEDIEDSFDFLSESHIEIAETMEAKAEGHEEESRDREDVEKLPAEKTDDIIWAYLRDIGHVSLLTSDEEAAG